MIVLRRLLREPFVQFLVIGTLVAGLYALVARTPMATEDATIDVGPGRIAQLTETFSRAWQRPPTADELTGLIEAFVKEEVFYREGVKMGLDRDDTVLRRRLQQKMEFLMEPGEAEMTPGEGELQNFFMLHQAEYKKPIQVAFRQIYFDPSRRGPETEKAAETLLARLNKADAPIDPASQGDATLLPASVPLSSLERIRYDFGDAFADGLVRADKGRWSGPVKSGFGLHLVYVQERREAHLPALADIGDEVLRDWQDEKRRKIADARFNQLRAHYKIVITFPDADLVSSQAVSGEEK